MECLITKLKGIVNDSSLPKINELIVEANNASNAELEMNYTGVDYRTYGNVTVKDINNGKKTITGTGKVFFSNQGNENQVYEVKTWGAESLSFPNLMCNFLKSCSNLYISNLGYKTPLGKALNRTIIKNSDIIGDYSKLMQTEELDLYNCTFNGQIFDIGNLPNNSIVTKICLNGMASTGDISKLNAENYPKLKEISFWGNKSSTGLYGDISKILPSGQYIMGSYGKGYSWSDRPASSKILALGTINLGDDLDKMFINQATLEIGSSYSYKIFIVKGNRTSASDEAIATLQGKGFTIKIEPA